MRDTLLYHGISIGSDQMRPNPSRPSALTKFDASTVDEIEPQIVDAARGCSSQMPGWISPSTNWHRRSACRVLPSTVASAAVTL